MIKLCVLCAITRDGMCCTKTNRVGKDLDEGKWWILCELVDCVDCVSCVHGNINLCGLVRNWKSCLGQLRTELCAPLN